MSRQTTVERDQYAPIAEFYDLEHDRFTDDIPMYQQVVDMVGDPVVELACGSGRILRPLACSGRRLTGVDSSAVMLERCRERFSDAPEQPVLLREDMTQANLPEVNFGVAIIGLNSLMHAQTQELQRDTLAVAFRSLDPRGLLVVDLPNPVLHVHDTGDRRVRTESSFETTHGLVTKFSSQDIDLAEQRIESLIWYDVVSHDNALRRFVSEALLRFVYRSELDLLLRTVGFAGAEYYGTYDLDPYVADSPRLIAFAERS